MTQDVSATYHNPTQGQKFPIGYYFLLLIQICSTISFSFLYSSMVLFTTHALHLPDAKATSITATFVAFNYALHLLGGYIGGRWLSFKQLFVIGMSLEIIGCLILAKISIYSMYWGLAFFLVGAGLNVTCINCLLTMLFSPEDPRRESAFIWNYSGMNFGFFMGFVISGYMQMSDNYTTLFELGAVANFLSLMLMLSAWRFLCEKTTDLSSEARVTKKIYAMWGSFVIGLLLLVIHSVLQTASLSNQLILGCGLFVIFYLVWQARMLNEAARQKVYAFMLLGICSLVFWTLYQMAPMALTLFIERNVNRDVFGITIPPQWVNNVNTMVIIMGGPLVTMLLSNLRKKDIRFTNPTQFSLALFLISIAFLVLPVGISFADPLGYSALLWIVLCFFIQSVGELFISPIGYAMVGQLAPQHLQGVMMGAWMMLTGVSAVFSSFFTLGDTATVDPILTNPSYSQMFNQLGILALLCAICTFLLRSKIERMMGIEPEDEFEDDGEAVVAE
jgi:POT family proton-dependent oligopeptide transporter